MREKGETEKDQILWRRLEGVSDLMRGEWDDGLWASERGEGGGTVYYKEIHVWLANYPVVRTTFSFTRER